MISKEFKLDGKIVIPVIMKNQVGRSTITGTFYVYEDETLAKKHVNPTIFTRLEKAQAKKAEAEAAAAPAESDSAVTAEGAEKPENKEEKSE